MKPAKQETMKSKLLIALIIVISIFTESAFPQTSLVLNGAGISIFGDTLYIKGNLVVRKNSVYGNNIYNAGTMIITDSIYNGVVDLFKSSSANCIGKIILEGNAQQTFIGYPLWLNHLQLSNSSGLKLYEDIAILGSLIFEKGSVNLNGFNISLFDLDPAINLYSGTLVNESDKHRLYDNSSLLPGGKINSYIKSVNSYVMPGNLGLEIQKPSGEIYIERGHMAIPHAGRGSIRKYFNLHSQDDQPIDLRFHYLDSADLAGTDLKEESLRLFSSPLNSATVYFEGGTNDLFQNRIDKEGLGQNRLFTLSDEHCPDPPPISFLKDTLNVCEGDSANLQSLYPSFLHKWYNHTYTILDTSETLSIKNVEIGLEKYYLQIFDRRGCINIDSVTVIGRPLPVPQFITPPSACASDSLLLLSQAVISSGEMQQAWIINYTDTLEGSSCSLSLNVPGTWNLELRCESTYGCHSEVSKPLVVHPLPESNFQYQDLCSERKMLFINRSDMPSPGFIAECRWKINDTLVGKYTWPDALNALVYAFPATGHQKVSLEVVSGAGCRNEITQRPEVFDPPQAGFSVEGHCAGNGLRFTSQSTGGMSPFMFSWKMNSARLSGDSAFVYTFPDAGLYGLTLVYSSANGCTDSTRKDIAVFPKPGAAFTVSNACSGQTVAFMNGTADSLLYHWNVGGEESNEPRPSFIFSKEGIISAMLSVASSAGCRDSLQKEIQVMPSPSASFASAQICSGDTLNIIPAYSSDSLQAVWLLNGAPLSREPELRLPMALAAGNYILGLKMLSTNGCTGMEERMLTVNALPKIDLPTGISTCGDHYTLDAGTDVQEYLWSTGDSTQRTVVSQSGSYTVRGISKEGCSSEASTYVDLNSSVQPDPGPDRKACGSAILHSGYPGALCEWSTGETGESIMVLHTGLYRVKVTDQNGCTGMDSVTISILPLPLFDLGLDRYVCEAMPVWIGQEHEQWSYRWDSGQDEAVIAVTSDGMYRCSIISGDGCEASDSVGVWFKAVPYPDLPARLNICGSAALSAGPAGYLYQWNDGDTSRVKTITQSGRYSVALSNAFCKQAAVVEVMIYPLPVFDLGDDLLVCEGVKVTLAPRYIDPANIYLWNSGQIGPMTETLQGGVYTLTAATPAGCRYADSLVIHRLPLPEISLEDEYLLCPGDSLLLFAGNPENSYAWTSGSGLMGTTPFLSIDTTGVFSLTAWDAYGCLNRHNFSVHPSPGQVHAKYLVASEAKVNDTLVFINFSEPEPFGSFWDFGDRKWSLEQDAQHMYVRSNRYRSSLQVNNGYCEQSAAKEILIKPAEKPGKQAVVGNGISGQAILSFRAYPNPARDLICIEAVFSRRTDANLVVYNMQASELYRKSYRGVEEFSTTLQSGMLPPGLYIVLLRTDHDVMSLKLVVL